MIPEKDLVIKIVKAKTKVRSTEFALKGFESQLRHAKKDGNEDLVENIKKEIKKTKAERKENLEILLSSIELLESNLYEYIYE